MLNTQISRYPNEKVSFSDESSTGIPGNVSVEEEGQDVGEVVRRRRKLLSTFIAISTLSSLYHDNLRSLEHQQVRPEECAKQNKNHSLSADLVEVFPEIRHGATCVH